MKKRPVTGIVHPHLKILKKSGYADVARVLEYDGDVMSIPAERWDEVAGFLRAMPYGSTLRDIAEHRARWVRQRLRENPPFYAHNLRFIRDAMVVGEGAKYVKIGGKYIPFVSRSATDRLEDGRILNVVIKEGRADIWDPSIYGYPPGNWEVVKNPPMYAHNLYEKKTHGLNLKQMRRLYAMVSRGNQKAITYARNVLGIPFSESPSQVKAVVLHHVRDLAERKLGKMSFKKNEEYAERWLKRRLRGNPFGGETLRSFKQKYKGFEIIVEIQPNTVLATWTNGDILESDRFSGYELDEIFEEVKARIDALKRRRK